MPAFGSDRGRRDAGAADAADVHAAARHGVGGAGGALPHREAIQLSFGRHDVSNLQAHDGEAARDATEAMGATAYARGNHIAFNRRPDLHTAAHEAAHAVQQRQGVSLTNGVGRAGDPYERQADGVADAVVAGRSAEHLLGAPRGAGGGDAPVQMKKGGTGTPKTKRRGFRRGTELSEHKSNTRGSREDIIEKMHASDETLAEKIHDVLTTRKHKGNQLFFHLQTLVMGTTTLAGAYRALTNGDIFADIQATGLSDPQKRYLEHCIRDGKPGFVDKLELALGITTKTKGDKKEIDYLVAEHAAPVKDKLAAVRSHKVEITELFKGQARYNMYVAQLQYGVRKERGARRGQSDDEHTEKLMEAADRELARIILSSILEGKAPKVFQDKKLGIHKLAKKRLKKDISEWITRHTRGEHQYVTGPTTRTQAAFDKVTSEIPLVEKAWLTPKQVNYLKIRIVNSSPVGDEFYLEDDDRETSQLGDKAKEEREEDKKEHGVKIGALRTHLGSKIGKHEDDTVGTNSKKLKKLIKSLSDTEKDWFLRGYLSPREQMEWDDPDFDHQARLELRKKAVDLVGVDLKKAGLGHGGEFTELREKLLKRLDIGFMKTPTLARIKDYVKSAGEGEETNRGQNANKLLALVRKLRGDEFAALRSNKKLMDEIQHLLDPKAWERIQAMLGIGDQHDQLDKVTGKVEVDLFRAPGDKGERKYTREQARDVAQDEAELRPSHWGMLITATLKHSHVRRSSEINSLVTRAYMAAKRRERATKGGKEKELSGSLELAPMSIAEFMAAVLSSVSQAAMKVFEAEKKFKNALAALRAGTRPTVDEELEDAKFRNKAKYASGDKAGVTNIEKTFEDLSGQDLLDEWSNIQEFVVYKNRFEKLKGRQKRDAKEKLRTFVVDIRKDRHDYLVKTLSPKSLGKVLKNLRMKLADAMEKDPEVIETLAKAGFDNDELSQAKTRTLALGEEQKMRSTGAQYNTVNKGVLLGLKLIPGGSTIKPTSLSAQTKESMGELLGGHRKVESELSQGKDREEVIEGNIEDIKLQQEELARRGKNFDKMQKKYNRAVTFIAKALVTALIGAAMGAITVLTGGVGGALAVALGTVMITAKTLILKGVQLALEGDRFNTTKAVCDLAFKALLGAATGALAEFAQPELLEALGQGIVDPGVNLGFESMTNVAPTDSGGIATKSAIEYALGKGAKTLLKTAYKEITTTKYNNPALRAMIMLEMGGTILAGGATVAQEVFAPVNEALQSGSLIGEPTGNELVDMGLEKGAQLGGKGVTKGLGYLQKAGKYAPKLRKLLAKYYQKKHEHGEDRDENLGEIIPAVLASAEQAIAGMDDQIEYAIMNDGDYGALAMKKSQLIDLKKELEEEYRVWQEETEAKRGLDQEVSSAGIASVPLLLKAIELDELIHGEA